MAEPTNLFDPEFQNQLAQSASTQAIGGLDYDQKEAARSMRLQRLFGTPAAVINSDLEGFERQQKTTLIHEMVRNNTTIQDYINGNPIAARVSQDDYPQLDTWHRAARDFVRPPVVWDRIDNAVSQTIQSFGQVFSALPKQAAIMSRQTAEGRKEGLETLQPQDEPVDDSPAARAAFRLRRGQLKVTPEQITERKAALDERTAKPVAEDPLFQLGEIIDEFFKHIAPTDPAMKEEWLASKIPGGIGSVLGFTLGAGLFRMVKTLAGEAALPIPFTIATLGAVSQSVEQFEDATKAGANIEDALRASGFGGLLGTSEAVPIVRFLDRVDKSTGGTVKKALGNIIKQGLEEGIQEFGQKVGSNLVASTAVGYDPSRGTFHSAADDATTGFAVGVIMQTLAEMLGGKRGKQGQTPGKQAADRVKMINAYLAAGEVPPPGVDNFVDVAHALAAKEDLKLFKEAMSAAQKSQTRELSPELAEDFATKTVGEFTIGISSEAIDALYGKDLPALDDRKLGFVKDLQEQLSIARQTGADVQLSLAQLMAHGDPAIVKQLEDFVRLRPGGMTIVEIEEQKKRQEELEPFEGVIGQPKPIETTDDMARKEAGLDLYADVVKHDVTLKKVSEEPDPNYPKDPPFSTFHIFNDFGEQVGTVEAQLTPKNVLYIPWIGGFEAGAGKKKQAVGQPHIFGLNSTEAIFRQLAKEYPTATHVGGWRVSGARDKAGTTRWVQVPMKWFREKKQEAAEFLAQIQGWDEIEAGFEQVPELPGMVITQLPGGGTIKWQPQALWTEKKQEVWQAISDIADQIAPGVSLILGDEVKTKGQGMTAPAPVHGFFTFGGANAEPYIVLAYSDLGSVGTLLHEVIHHLRRGGFFSEGEWSVLEKAAKDNNWIDKHHVRERYPQGSEALMLEEAIAEEYKTWVKVEGNLEGKSAKEYAGVFGKLKEFFGLIRLKLQEIFGADVTFDRLFTEISSGEIGSRTERNVVDFSAAQMVAQATETEEQQMFERGTALGLTQPQFKKLMKLIEARQSEIEARARAKAEKAAQLTNTKEWKDALPQARKDAEAEIESRADVLADDYFRKGLTFSKPTTEKARIGEQYVTPEQKALLGANVVSKAGIDPMDIGWIFGFKTKDEMIGAMIHLHEVRKDAGMTHAQFKEQLIADRTEELMIQRMEPNLAIELNEARNDIVTETQMDMLHEELLAAMLKAQAAGINVGPPITKDDVKVSAKEAFQEIPVPRALKMEQWLKDSGKAGNAAFAAMLKGDYTEALRQKQRQMLSALFAQEAKALIKARDALDRTANKFRPREVKGVAHDFTTVTKRLLSKAGFSVNRTDEELDEGLAMAGYRDLGQFVDRANAFGWEITMPDYLVAEHVKPIEQMNVGELYEFKDGIDSLAQAGKLTAQVETLGGMRDFDEWRDQVLDNIRSLPPRDKAKPKRIAFGVDAEITRMEEIVKDLDLRQENGPLHQVLIHGTAEAKHTEYKLTEDLVKDLDKIKGFRKKWRSTLKDDIPNNFLVDPYDGTLFDLTREQMVNIMLNFGNRSNIDKFTQGYVERRYVPGESAKDRRERIKQEGQAIELQLRRMFDQYANPEDWKFVQAIWDVFGKWQPLANEMYHELSGVGPKWIKAEPINTPHGRFAGGYFPIIYDELRSDINVIEEAKPSFNSLFSGDYFRATVANHYTKERSNRVDRIAFEDISERLGARMQQMMHDIAYRRAIINVNKVIYDPQIRAAIRKHYGQEYEEQLEPWAKDMANHFNSNERAISVHNKFLRTMRFNLIAHALPLNLKVILSPDVGLLNLVALAKAVFAPREYTRIAHEKSLEIPHTFRNMDRDFRERLENLIQTNRWTEFQAASIRAGFWPVVKLSQGFRIITFVDAYKKAIATGMSEGEAVAHADSMVRTHHGAHGLPDMPAIMRTNEAMKIATTMYGFFSTMQNWRRQIPRLIRERDFTEAMKVYWGSTLIGTGFGMLLYNHASGSDDDEWYTKIAKSFVKAQSLEILGGFPFVREVANMAFEGQRSRTPLGGFIESMDVAANDVKRVIEGKEVKAPIRHTANVIGLGAGLPLGQVGRTAQGLRDVQTGEKDPPKNILEWIKLIIFGEVEEKKGRRR